MLQAAKTYQELYDGFRWSIPASYNMGWDVCDKHAARNPDSPALIVERDSGDPATYRFGDIRALSNKLANALIGLGRVQGERVGVLLPQSLETALTHVAVWKAGMISIPLFTLFGGDALEFRLKDSGAKVLITDEDNLWKLDGVRDRLPDLEHIILTGLMRAPAGGLRFNDLLDKASDRLTPVMTRPDDPALIIYTSGTTGNPKGALHGHRCLLGHMPAIEMFHDFFPQPGDLMWTPADWAWIGGLMNSLMGAWRHGVPVLACRARKFDPEAALDLMKKRGVRNTFMPPTALRLMMRVPGLAKRDSLPLRSLASAGEPLGAETFEWCRETLGLTPNEFYGQTECNIIVSNSATLMPARAGSIGRQVPGHRVDVIDENGAVLPPDETGELACRAPDPVMLLRYWNNQAATDAKMVNGWWRMGDLGTRDADGYLWFIGRDDDVITSAGYRIGPGEIEDTLARHPAVALSAVIGVPDPVRTEAVKAFIQLAPGRQADPALEADIREYVKTRLASHEYPRHIEFVERLPTTATGKIKRKDLRDREN